MTEEAKLIVAALRTSCEENGSCPDCPVNYWCHAKNGVRIEDDAADLIESLSEQLEQVTMERDGLNIMLSQALAMLETRTRERDAAVKYIDKNCETCAHLGDGEYVSNDCMDCMRNCNWQWRGVEVNNDAQKGSDAKS